MEKQKLKYVPPELRRLGSADVVPEPQTDDESLPWDQPPLPKAEPARDPSDTRPRIYLYETHRLPAAHFGNAIHEDGTVLKKRRSSTLGFLKDDLRRPVAKDHPGCVVEWVDEPMAHPGCRSAIAKMLEREAGK